ncbi:MAG: hypothetical protein ACOYXU_13435 [Nitrospirota bacterium]
MNTNADETDEWLPVIARSLAFLCLAKADLRDKDLATQGRFLESLGLSRKEAAALLGTSYASLTELISKASKKKGGRRGGAKKKG